LKVLGGAECNTV